MNPDLWVVLGCDEEGRCRALATALTAAEGERLLRQWLNIGGKRMIARLVRYVPAMDAETQRHGEHREGEPVVPPPLVPDP